MKTLFIILFLSSFFCYADVIPPKVMRQKHAVLKPMRTFLKVIPLEEASGFFIDQNTFVTNFHVLAKWAKHIPSKFPFSLDITRAPQHLKYPNLKSIQFTGVQQLSILHDLVLLKTSKPVPEEFILKPGKTINKNVYIIGYPGNDIFMLVRQFSGRIIEQNSFNITVDVDFPLRSFEGVSGTPMFNENGEVVGVFSSEYTPTGLVVGIPIKHTVQLQELPDLSHIPLEDLIQNEINNLKALAESGDPLAQFTLGFKLLEGEILTKNEEDAIKWLKKAAMKNQLSAVVLILNWLRNKIDELWIQGSTDSETFKREFRRWLLHAAKNGSVWAYFYLSYLTAHSAGKRYGFQKNLEDSADWLFKAAKKGHDKSHKLLLRIANKKSNPPYLQSKIEFYLKELKSCPHALSNP